MSGVVVIRYLLAHASAITAVVPAERIMAGDLPPSTALPAISVMQISSVPHNPIRTNETPKSHTDRVQVSALLKDQSGDPQGDGWPGLRTLLRLILAACPSQRGAVNGINVDSITPDVEGPDIPMPDVSMVSRSRDFLVRWSA